ncbi:hypothetical protein HSBAA_64160 [Vreelandella sulfidaeris]|uniref:Aldehyde oxidase/xanthine dehydrogenase first molybdopterin binding domain-containing protein n=1 Tax=Vreelandella sulfidaeris TaxID=115553 RepID=A0A455UFW6_9GAMM|nr:hypothetical protein HSBAA_64160 [Halomonas sulfidaeris]
MTLDEVYRTASQSHAMMEPHASIVDWSDGGQMTVWTSNQMVEWTRQALATTFNIDADTIRLESPLSVAALAVNCGCVLTPCWPRWVPGPRGSQSS